MSFLTFTGHPLKLSRSLFLYLSSTPLPSAMPYAKRHMQATRKKEMMRTHEFTTKHPSGTGCGTKSLGRPQMYHTRTRLPRITYRGRVLHARIRLGVITFDYPFFIFVFPVHSCMLCLVLALLPFALLALPRYCP